MREIIADKELSGLNRFRMMARTMNSLKLPTTTNTWKPKPDRPTKRAQPYDWTAQSQDLCHWKKGLPIWG